MGGFNTLKTHVYSQHRGTDNTKGCFQGTGATRKGDHELSLKAAIEISFHTYLRVFISVRDQSHNTLVAAILLIS